MNFYTLIYTTRQKLWVQLNHHRSAASAPADMFGGTPPWHGETSASVPNSQYAIQVVVYRPLGPEYSFQTPCPMPQMVGSEFNHYSLVAYPHLRDHVHIDPVPFSFGTESQVVDMSEDTTALEMSRGRGQHRPYGRPPERVKLPYLLCLKTKWLSPVEDNSQIHT